MLGATNSGGRFGTVMDAAQVIGRLRVGREAQ